MKYKIKFLDFWPTFNPKQDPFFSNLFKWYDLELVDNNPDILIFSGVYGKLQNYKNYKDCIKIFYSEENRDYINEYFNDSDYSISHHIRNTNNHLRIPGCIRRYGLDMIKELTNIKPINNSNKFCCFIYSNPVKFRNDFFLKLNSYKHVDSCGPVLNNMPNNWRLPKDNEIMSRKLDDIKFISQYKFFISFENEVVDGYVSEKLTKPLFANSIPIYYGSPSVNLDFNEQRFINANNKSFDNILDEIKLLDNNNKLYNDKLKEPVFINNCIPIYWTEKFIKSWFNKIFK